jgi:hypothetical protein
MSLINANLLIVLNLGEIKSSFYFYATSNDVTIGLDAAGHGLESRRSIQLDFRF